MLVFKASSSNYIVQPGLRTTGFHDLECRFLSLYGIQELRIIQSSSKYLLSACYVPPCWRAARQRITFRPLVKPMIYQGRSGSEYFKSYFCLLPPPTLHCSHHHPFGIPQTCTTAASGTMNMPLSQPKIPALGLLG